MVPCNSSLKKTQIEKILTDVAAPRDIMSQRFQNASRFFPARWTKERKLAESSDSGEILPGKWRKPRVWSSSDRWIVENILWPGLEACDSWRSLRNYICAWHVPCLKEIRLTEKVHWFYSISKQFMLISQTNYNGLFSLRSVENVT